MSDHFSAFSFVDRILEIEPGVSIRGEYQVPANLEQFHPSLLGEAVGQLAAWAAMAAVDFEYRPVAGLGGRIELGAPVKPGDKIELSANIDRADKEAVSYGGVATIKGEPAITLKRALGPMLPMADFDNRDEVKARFDLICGEGAAPNAYRGIPELDWEQTEDDEEGNINGIFHVPGPAPFYQDHFPQRPVFPGSLLMEVCMRFVNAAANARSKPEAGGTWKTLAISRMKIRDFTNPGEDLKLSAKLTEETADSATWLTEFSKDGQVNGTVRVLLVASE